ncbi:hypothetical protein HUU42_00460 [bacterium]|nr:hypothetical protein [bacterium]
MPIRFFLYLCVAVIGCSHSKDLILNNPSSEESFNEFANNKQAKIVFEDNHIEIVKNVFIYGDTIAWIDNYNFEHSVFFSSIKSIQFHKKANAEGFVLGAMVGATFGVLAKIPYSGHSPEDEGGGTAWSSGQIALINAAICALPSGFIGFLVGENINLDRIYYPKDMMK